MKTAWLYTALLATIPAWCGSAPDLTRLEPHTIAPYREARLKLIGSGFASGARVYIESGTPGKFLGYAVSDVAPNEVEVTLTLGFGPQPASRRIYVQNPDGARSPQLLLHIDAVTAGQLEIKAEESVEQPTVPAEFAVRPVIHVMDPAAIPAAVPVRVEVQGEGFADGAVVAIAVNVHAGTNALPEYRLREFTAEQIEPNVLEVSFDRGFYPLPAIREVVVINPDGLRSEPANLRINAMEMK